MTERSTTECSLKPGSQLKDGKYTIRKWLGQGGFGITYLATTPALVKGELGEMTVEAKVVVKEFFMKEECTRAEDGHTLTVVSAGKADLVDRYRRKFKDEARSLRKMGKLSRHIVKVADIIEGENNTVYYVMEFLPGGTLQQLVKPERDSPAKPLDQQRAVTYVTQVATALKQMHSQRMCHFDVKPDNIMLNAKGEAVLIDFGLAKNYRKDGHQLTSLLIGATSGYAPLEQAKADLEDFKPLSDIYALGATLYFLLTGHRPHEADIHLDKVLPWGQCGMADYLWLAIQECMQADYEKRPQSIDEMLKLLEPPTISDEEEDTGETVVIVPRQQRKPLPWKRIYAITASVIVGLGIVAVVHKCGREKQQESELTVNVWQVAEKDTTQVEYIKLQVDGKAINDDNGKLLYTYSGEVNQKGERGEEATKEAKPDGQGKATYPKSDSQKRSSYVGEFSDGKRHGKGTLTWNDGSYFQGVFSQDNLSEGKYCLADGSYYQGTFSANVPYNGTWYNADGTVYKKVANGK